MGNDASRKIGDVSAKAIRIVLALSLVFWMSQLVGVPVAHAGEDSASVETKNAGFTDKQEAADVETNASQSIKATHVSFEASGGASDVDSGLKVSIDYRPVPKGRYAELVASPNRHIGSGSYNLQWQYSADVSEGSWKNVDGGTVQVLRVVTDDEHIGMFYRVVLTSELLIADDENRVAISDPVQIVEAPEYFSVTLAYDPPAAGDTAIFTSSIYAIGEDGNPITIDPKDVTYTWETKTAASGNYWTTIPGEYGSSLAIPTNPVDESDLGEGKADDNSGIQLTYIRVRAKTTDTRVPEGSREAVSQAQPLTVYVGGGDDPYSNNEQGDPIFTGTSEPGVSGPVPEDKSNEGNTRDGGNYVISLHTKILKMGKKAKLGVKPAKGSRKVTYRSSNKKVVKVSKKGVLTPVHVGKATITITLSKSRNLHWVKYIHVTVKRGSQKLAFKKQEKSIKASELAKSARTVAIARAKGAKTPVRYSIIKVSKSKYENCFTINKKTGKIKVGKGIPKGTYKLRVKARAATGKNWNAAVKTAVITIKVK